MLSNHENQTMGYSCQCQVSTGVDFYISSYCCHGVYLKTNPVPALRTACVRVYLCVCVCVCVCVSPLYLFPLIPPCLVPLHIGKGKHSRRVYEVEGRHRGREETEIDG